MSTESNKAIVRRYREIYNTDQLDKLSDVLAENFVPHSLLPGMTPSLETYKQIHQMAKAAFPDLLVTTEEILTEGDKVVERWTQTMTHTGAPFMNIPPSNKPITFTGISIYRVANGKIVEHWANMDMFGMLAQMGAIPVPGT